MNNRFLLTGGPGAGKTAVLRELELQGFRCMPDVARSIIQERVSRRESPRPENKKFARLIYDAAVRNYDTTIGTQDVIFFERGIPDALGMLAECGSFSPDDILIELAIRPYDDQVFFFPFWADIYVTDTERDQTMQQAAEISAMVDGWYRRLGFSLIEVPRESPSERAAFIHGFVETLGRT